MTCPRGVDDTRHIWKLRNRSIDVSRGILMGVVNVTPDSFSDGGEYFEPDTAVEAGVALHAAGAQIVDVGGESTRPGSDPVSAEEEMRRVLPVVSGLGSQGLVVSIDTTKPLVAEACLEAGASIVNDVTACGNPNMVNVIAESGAGVILMHAQGAPKTMQANPTYEDVVAEVASFLRQRMQAVVSGGVSAEAIALDPGIGFGKTIEHNLELIAHLNNIADIGRPVVLGASRKSFLGALTGIDNASDRDGATAVTTALGFERGARVFRVHDVVSSQGALAISAAIVAHQRWDEWLQG